MTWKKGIEREKLSELRGNFEMVPLVVHPPPDDRARVEVGHIDHLDDSEILDVSRHSEQPDCHVRGNRRNARQGNDAHCRMYDPRSKDPTCLSAHACGVYHALPLCATDQLIE